MSETAHPRVVDEDMETAPVRHSSLRSDPIGVFGEIGLKSGNGSLENKELVSLLICDGPLSPDAVWNGKDSWNTVP